MTDPDLQTGPPPAFYLPAGETVAGAQRFLPTDYTRSVWDTSMQHGSPPAALMVRAIERGHPRSDARPTRVTVELLGPVPVDETHVRTSVVRPGRNIELIRAELDARLPDGSFRTAATATVWRMATADTSAALFRADPPMRASGGEVASGFGFFGRHDGITYLDAVDWRWLAQASDEGPGLVWAREKVELVKGEAPSPLERMFGIIDAANGVAARLDPRRWTFLNTEMTVHIHRVPQADELGLEAASSIGPDGVGMCSAVVHDAAGPVARTAQSLLIRRR